MAVGRATTVSDPSGQQTSKRRAACDECRTKKLKCGGEHPQCSRCLRECISCVYSPPKQMGRPRKRLRSDEGLESSIDHDRVGAEGRNGSRLDRQESHERRISKDESRGMVPASNVEERGFDASEVFTPGGGLQPWLQPSDGSGGPQWDTALPGLDAILPAETSVPSLTPDSSSNSPPTTHLPADLNPLLHAQNHHDPSTQLLLDPSLTDLNLGLPDSAMPPCACLSTMYLTLNTLQSMPPAFTFPQALHPLREAMQTSSEVLRCEHCPTKSISAVQNTHLLGVLLVSIAERFGRILESIAAEIVRAKAAHETKTLRLAELNTPTSHLHMGNLNCATGFTVNASPTEWRTMAKKVVKAEVYGPGDGNHCCVHFLAVTAQMQQRQESWHCAPPTQDFPRDAEGRHLGGPQIPREDHVCLKMIAYANKLVDAFDWS